MNLKCLVKGCTNYPHQGKLIGHLCEPCHRVIITCDIGPTNSFIGTLHAKANAKMNMILTVKDGKVVEVQSTGTLEIHIEGQATKPDFKLITTQEMREELDRRGI